MEFWGVDRPGARPTGTLFLLAPADSVVAAAAPSHPRRIRSLRTSDGQSAKMDRWMNRHDERSRADQMNPGSKSGTGFR